MREISLKTNSREELLDITREVAAAVTESGISNGLCHLHCLHTTAGITINENTDPAVKTDILMALRRLVQDGWHYYHAEGNSPAHIKSSLIGVSLTIPFSEGRLALGTWQSVVFCEFDGPRARKVSVSFTRTE
jgi:secondary thiamine-phosphate synthase enzyme